MVYEVHLTRVVRWSTVFRRSHTACAPASIATATTAACSHARRIFDPAVAQEEQLAARSLLIDSSLPPMLDRQTYCNPYCNRAVTHWYTTEKRPRRIIENRLNKRNFRTQ